MASEKKKVFRLPAGVRNSRRKISDDPTLTPDDHIPPSTNPKTEFRRRSTPAMRLLTRMAVLKSTTPNYFDNLESVDVMRTGMAVKSRDALMSDIRSGKIKIPGRVREGKKVQNPGGVHVADPAISIRRPEKPGDEPKYLRGLFERGSVDGSGNPTEVEVAGWAWANRAAKSWRDRGKPVDDEGRARVGKVTIDGETYVDGQMDQAVRASEGIARKNEIARKTYDVLKATGAYSPSTLEWIRKGRFGKDGIARELNEIGRGELYKEGFGGLRTRYQNLSRQAGVYQQKLNEAQESFAKSGGFRGFDDFVAKKMNEYGLDYGKEYAAYERNAQQKIAAAERAHNPGEVARLRQVLEGRRVQMQEMAQKKAMSMWSGSGAANLWRAQKELEDTLANQQATALKGMNAAMQSNAVLAKQLGVPVQSLLDGKALVADKSFGTQVAEWEAQNRGEAGIVPDGGTGPAPVSEVKPPVSEEQPGTSGADSQTADVGRKRNPWEVV